jgi:hypothetical protein
MDMLPTVRGAAGMPEQGRHQSFGLLINLPIFKRNFDA